jgi:multicomponent Na+:H+ antiporter subunit D
LNAAYFLPILWRIWFRQPAGPWQELLPAKGWRETPWLLLLPPVFSALATVAAAVFADTGFSPLGWAKMVAAEEYLR